MRVFNDILIQLGQLVRLKLWMVSQGEAQSLNPEMVVIQEGLSNLYIQINQSQNVLHVALYIRVRECPATLSVSNVTNKATFQDCIGLLP